MNKIFFLMAILMFLSPAAKSQLNVNGLGSSITKVTEDHSSGEANGNSIGISISDDGNEIVFESDASNLVSSDDNGIRDVFLHDVNAGTVVLVSKNSSSELGNRASFEAKVSGDGDHIVFTSLASNLVSSDTNNCSDIFVYDISADTIERASLTDSDAESEGCSHSPSISDDGRYVAFLSDAADLVSNDTNKATDIFVRDLQLDTTIRASLDTSENEANAETIDGMISGNGTYVVFTSLASNLVSSDDNLVPDIFVRNLSTTTTELVSKSSAGTIGNQLSESPDISSDGRYVVFRSRAGNLVSGDTNGYADIFRTDRNTNSISRASIESDGTQIWNSSHSPKVSNDGRFITFTTLSSDLVTEDSNKSFDVMIHDFNSSSTTVVSSEPTGPAIGNASTKFSDISGDGSILGIASSASNLITTDTNAAYDVFIRDNSFDGQLVTVEKLSNIAEGSGTQNAFRITRHGDTTSSLTVNYTLSGTATITSDYTDSNSGSITIAASATYIDLPFTVVDDSAVEGTETIVVNLTKNFPTYQLGGSYSSTTEVTDND